MKPGPHSYTLNRAVYGLCIMAALLSACSKADETSSPPANPEIVHTAGALFAQPTRPVRPPATITPANDIGLELNRVVAQMEQAVRAGDILGYLDYISTSDPDFLTEHTHWAQDWVNNPLSDFTIDLFNIRSAGPTTAKARMTLRWSRRDANGMSSAGGATLSVVFVRSSESWVWAGEDWSTLEDHGLRLSFFDDAITNNRRQAETMMGILPGILTRLTREFDFVPSHSVHIRLYDSAATLQTMTRISQPDLTSWNVPGEAIKVALDPNRLPPPEPILAGHLSRFLLYEMAEETPGAFPWWLEEGIAAYGEALFRPLSERDRWVESISALMLSGPGRSSQLTHWDDFGSPPSWDDPRRQPAASQTYTLIAYITETWGAQARNAWIRAIAEGHPLDEACVEQLGLTLDELDAGWRAWLAARQ